jgi:hypothetical protein
METKPWYQSLTIWGVAILTLCGLVLPAIGQGDIADFAKEENVNIIDILAAIGGVIGSIMAIIGRWRAHKSLSVSNAAIMLLACSLLISGCATTRDGSMKDYVMSSNLCTGTASAFTPLIEAGVFNQSQTDEIHKTFFIVNEYFHQWRAALDSNELSPDISFKIHDALDILIQQQIDALKSRKGGD